MARGGGTSVAMSTTVSLRWRTAQSRLMSLSRTGKIACMAYGTLPYLEMLARRSRVRGRKWIELNTAPATVMPTVVLALDIPELARQPALRARPDGG
jgi:hypothetical protein